MTGILTHVRWTRKMLGPDNLAHAHASGRKKIIRLVHLPFSVESRMLKKLCLPLSIAVSCFALREQDRDTRAHVTLCQAEGRNT
jgi:hypothetical protein